MKIDLTNKDKSLLEDLSSVLITGGSGVIGRHLIAAWSGLKSSGHFSGKILTTVRSGDSDELFDLGADSVFRGDLTTGGDFIESEYWDVCFHGASPSQPSEFLKDPIGTIELNTGVTKYLKGRTRESFLFMSSSEVYSGLTISPRETDIGTTTPDHPRAPYIESKRLGEVLTKSARGALPNVRSNVARIALAYGPGAGAADTRVMYELVRRAIQDGEVRLNGGHDQVRTYCHAGDVAEILIKIALVSSKATVNVGGDERVTMRDLAQLIALKTGALYLEDSRLTSLPAGQQGSPSMVSLDLSLMRSLTDFHGFVSLETGLVEVIDFYKKKLNLLK